MTFELLKNKNLKKEIKIPLFVILATKIPYKKTVVVGESMKYQTVSYLFKHHYRSICRK